MIVHQKPYVLTSRIITLGMARGIMCEQKGKQLNQASYVEWTNIEQLQRARAKGGIGNKFKNMSNEGENFDEELDVDMLEVSEQGLPSTILQLYLTFQQKLFTMAEQVFLVKKKGKEDMIIAKIRASSLMDNRRNQLVFSQNKLD